VAASRCLPSGSWHSRYPRIIVAFVGSVCPWWPACSTFCVFAALFGAPQWSQDSRPLSKQPPFVTKGAPQISKSCGAPLSVTLKQLAIRGPRQRSRRPRPPEAGCRQCGRSRFGAQAEVGRYRQVVLGGRAGSANARAAPRRGAMWLDGKTDRMRTSAGGY